MKNFPSFLAVCGAWLCATGFVLPGIVCFLASSFWSIFHNRDYGFYSLAFLAANMVAFFRLI
jgi:hypothetical protein